MEDIYKMEFDTSWYNRSAICRLVCILKSQNSHPNTTKENAISTEMDNKEDAADSGELDDTTKLNTGEGEETIYKKLNHYLVIAEVPVKA